MGKIEDEKEEIITITTEIKIIFNYEESIWQ